MVPESPLSAVIVRSLALLATVSAALAPASAWATCTPQAYLVTSNADDGSSGTLRWAVGQANACPGSEIDFSLSSQATITLSTANSDPEIVISAGMTINGPGATNLTVSGGNATRIFFINPGSGVAVNINNLTLANGYGLGGNGGGGAAGMGGAIFQESGTLNITDAVLNGNTAQGGGTSDNASNGPSNSGGGGFGGSSTSNSGASGGDLGGTGGAVGLLY
ncbi:MAG: hypothetical protein WB992_04665, partial [Bryobacteraceae bacterium]